MTVQNVSEESIMREVTPTIIICLVAVRHLSDQASGMPELVTLCFGILESILQMDLLPLGECEVLVLDVLQGNI